MKVQSLKHVQDIYKSDTVNELPLHNFIFQHSRWHCPNIKSWNQLLYPRVIEVCRQPFERHDFFLHLIIVIELSGVW